MTAADGLATIERTESGGWRRRTPKPFALGVRERPPADALLLFPLGLS